MQIADNHACWNAKTTAQGNAKMCQLSTHALALLINFNSRELKVYRVWIEVDIVAYPRY